MQKCWLEMHIIHVVEGSRATMQGGKQGKRSKTSDQIGSDRMMREMHHELEEAGTEKTL